MNTSRLLHLPSALCACVALLEGGFSLAFVREWNDRYGRRWA